MPHYDFFFFIMQLIANSYLTVGFIFKSFNIYKKCNTCNAIHACNGVMKYFDGFVLFKISKC